MSPISPPGTICSGCTELLLSSCTMPNPPPCFCTFPLPGKPSPCYPQGDSHSPFKFPLKGFLLWEPFPRMLLSGVSNFVLSAVHALCEHPSDTKLWWSATCSHVLCPATPRTRSFMSVEANYSILWGQGYTPPGSRYSKHWINKEIQERVNNWALLSGCVILPSESTQCVLWLSHTPSLSSPLPPPFTD